MEKYRITITEKQKFVHSFNLLNFRDEVVNFMYKKTVAGSTRKNILFYVAVFFLSLKVEDKSLFRDLIEKNVDKLRRLNLLLKERKRLKKGEYAELVSQAGLTEVLKYDVLFLLISAIIDANEIRADFETYLKKNKEIREEFDLIIKEYADTFAGFREEFSSYLLIDDRWDDRGHYHDLSKSVFRPVKMRTSRQVDLALHKYAEVKSIKSDSPIVLVLLQSIDPEILIRIWEIYNLDEYVKGTWNVLNTPLISSTVGGILAGEWLHWRSLNGRKDRKEKEGAKKMLDAAKKRAAETGKTDDLLNGLVKSVLSTNEYLQSEIKRLNKELRQLRNTTTIENSQQKEIDALEERIAKLENISIEIKKED